MLIQLLYYLLVNFLFPFLGIILIPRRSQKLWLKYSKYLGLIVYTVLLWYLGTILPHLFPNMSWQSIGLVLFVAWLILSFYFQTKEKYTLLKAYTKQVYSLEIISFFIFWFLNLLRFSHPDIMGTERPMDYSFIHNLYKQPFLPPENPWLTGAVLNYYYLGQFLLASLYNLLRINLPLFYNLSISMIGILAFQAYYFLIATIKPQIPEIRKLLYSSALTFGGNLYLLYYLIKHGTINFFYPEATRVIPKTINEFPAYSIIVGDLHGHFIALPFFIIGIAFIVTIFIEKTTTLPEWLFLGLTGFFLFASNSWDAIVLFEILILFTMNSPRKILGTIKKYKSGLMLIILPILILTLLFKHTFIPPINGIGFTIAEDISPIRQYIWILWGQFLPFYLISLFLESNTSKKLSKMKLLVYLGTVAIFNLILVNFIYLKDIFSIVNPPYARANTVFKIYYQIWTLLGVSTLLLMDKIIFRSDINKYIKIVLKSGFALSLFIMLSYFPKAIIDNFPIHKIDSVTLLKSITSTKYTTYLLGENALKFFWPKYKIDYTILNIVKKESKHRPVTIVEAMKKKSYSMYGRIAVYSGNRMIIGWPFHITQWYNGYKFSYINYPTVPFLNKNLKIDSIDNRLKEIEIFYNATPDRIVYIKKLIQKYRVKFIVFGQLEYETYPKQRLNVARRLLSNICPPVYEQGNFALLKCF